MRRSIGIAAAALLSAAAATANSQPAPAGDPPARVGRLAIVTGTVSFHDNQQTAWSPAVANTPLTSGDAVWTEPNAKSEISIAGTRVRLDGATELDMLAVDDTQTRMQLDQGRIDIKTFTYDTHQPYTIVTPRGVISLQQQGDYYVLAGSTDDPTTLGVRSGAAQIQAANGQVLAVRAGEIGVITGTDASPQLQTMHQAPPPMPAYWDERDRQIVYDQPPQYLSADVTGYEDLNYYGSWQSDPDYGEVWIPRAVAADWQPYHTGRWDYVAPWGWTWVDDQPWGFAPYHYGRWAHRGDRWMWVPPQRDVRPVYAPALVAFVGGLELGVALGVQSAQPVGWFPLGPREAYVPSYTRDHDYYRRLNASAHVENQILEDRWQRAERHEALRADERNEQLANRRFATVVPAQAFTRSELVQRAALKIDPQKMNAVVVAPVAAPPSPRVEMRANVPPRQPNQSQTQPARPNAPATNTQYQAIGRPSGADVQHHEAPGPKFAAHTNATGNVQNSAQQQGAKPNLPQLEPRHPGAPAPAPIRGLNKAPQPPAQGQAQQPNLQNQARPQQAEHAAPPAGQPAPSHEATPNGLPPVRAPQAQRPAEPQRPSEPTRSTPAAPVTPPSNTQQHTTPATPATPSPNAQQQHATPQTVPQPQHQAETPRPQAQPQQHQEPPRVEQRQVSPAPQQHAAPQQQAQPPVQHQAPPQQAQQPHPQPQPQVQHQAPPQQAQQPHPQPQPQVQHQATPPPQQQQHQQQAQQPAPQHQQEQKKDEKK
jgi:hypothetical protein